MCTKEEVQEIVDAKLDAIMAKILRYLATGGAGLLILGAGSWYGLYYQVQAVARDAETAKLELAKGDRFTKADADALRDEFQRQIVSLQEQNNQLRADMNTTYGQIRADLRELRTIVINN